MLVPCFNEEIAIAKVVADFRAALPHATIYVYDNNSTDRTVEVARAAGAVVRREPHQGKGHVVRRMFADVDADIYVLVDGDATYDAPSARVDDRPADRRAGSTWWSAARVDQEDGRLSARTSHRQPPADGICRATCSAAAFTDMLSGYRVFSRRFVKSFPVLSRGFEIETELTVHALGARAAGRRSFDAVLFAAGRLASRSSSTWRDGLRILATIVKLYRSERPLAFFTGIAIALSVVAVGLAIPVFVTYFEEGSCRGCRPPCSRPD